MKQGKLKAAAIAAILAGTSLSGMPVSAANPVVQTVYTADGAPMVWNDTFYLYTGHDEDNSTNFTMNDWRCYTSTDMQNWTDRMAEYLDENGRKHPHLERCDAGTVPHECERGRDCHTRHKRRQQ